MTVCSLKIISRKIKIGMTVSSLTPRLPKSQIKKKYSILFNLKPICKQDDNKENLLQLEPFNIFPTKILYNRSVSI